MNDLNEVRFIKMRAFIQFGIMNWEEFQPRMNANLCYVFIEEISVRKFQNHFDNELRD